MKSIITSVLTITLLTASIAQPNGNGGNGNNGKGKGGCGNPPCGGPNAVPIDIELLLLAGFVAGSYIKYTRRFKTKA